MNPRICALYRLIVICILLENTYGCSKETEDCIDDPHSNIIDPSKHTKAQQTDPSAYTGSSTTTTGVTTGTDSSTTDELSTGFIVSLALGCTASLACILSSLYCIMSKRPSLWMLKVRLSRRRRQRWDTARPEFDPGLSMEDPSRHTVNLVDPWDSGDSATDWFPVVAADTQDALAATRGASGDASALPVITSNGPMRPTTNHQREDERINSLDSQESRQNQDQQGINVDSGSGGVLTSNYVSLDRDPSTRQYIVLGRGAFSVVYQGTLVDFMSSISFDGNIGSAGMSSPEIQSPRNQNQHQRISPTRSNQTRKQQQPESPLSPQSPPPAATTPVAVKVILRAGFSGERAFQNEANLLRQVNALNTEAVRFYGTSENLSGRYMLILELMEGGDLRDALSAPDNSAVLLYGHGKDIALSVTSALMALHKARIIHRDVKSKNVLLTSTYRAKLADVGTSTILEKNCLSGGHIAGTLAWSAPESIEGKQCDEKMDVYSLGVVLWEIATGLKPKSGVRPSVQPSAQCPQELCALIEDCTAYDRKKRPSAQQVYERLLRTPPLNLDFII